MHVSSVVVSCRRIVYQGHVAEEIVIVIVIIITELNVVLAVVAVMVAAVQ